MMIKVCGMREADNIREVEALGTRYRYDGLYLLAQVQSVCESVS